MSDLFIALASVAFGAAVLGTVSYYVGRRRGRERLHHERRVATVTQLFKLMRETQWALVNASAPSDIHFVGNPSREQRADDFEEKLEELDGFQRDNQPWLTEEVRRELEALIDLYHEVDTELRERLEESQDQDSVVESIHDDAAEETGDKMLAIFDKLIKSL
jgi:hypothetical protein